MNIDENIFFRQATVLICKHLEIETALFELLIFLKNFLPVNALFLNLFEENFSAIRTIASASDAGGSRLDRLTHLTNEAREYMKLGDVYLKKYGRLKAQIINQPAAHTVSKLMIEDFNSPDTSHLALSLSTDGKLIGNLVLEAIGTDRFTDEHAELVTLLNEPMAIAMSNTLKHDELKLLKDQLQDDNRYFIKKLSQSALEEVVGGDFGLKDVIQKAKQVAPLNSPVLLLGETGTGKELIASLIHSHSERRNGPLITINCGAIPDSLLDSELFGHEKGAFTGALTQKKGHFERASRGTVFLDEIGELPQQAQVRLLRVIQNNEIQRVGGTQTIPIDIRIVAATHRDLETMVKNGNFREDLWFRLNVFPILLPPLRERKNDIPALVQHFIEKKSKQMVIRRVPKPAKNAIDPLMAYAWPGNVRELENVVERALILHQGEPLVFDHLLQNDRCSTSHQTKQPSSPANPLIPLDDVIRDHLIQALQVANGKIHGKAGAAERIGLNPNTFRSKLRKLGIDFKKTGND